MKVSSELKERKKNNNNLTRKCIFTTSHIIILNSLNSYLSNHCIFTSCIDRKKKVQEETWQQSCVLKLSNLPRAAAVLNVNRLSQNVDS